MRGRFSFFFVYVLQLLRPLPPPATAKAAAAAAKIEEACPLQSLAEALLMPRRSLTERLSSLEFQFRYRLSVGLIFACLSASFLVEFQYCFRLSVSLVFG